MKGTAMILVFLVLFSVATKEGECWRRRRAGMGPNVVRQLAEEVEEQIAMDLAEMQERGAGAEEE